MGFSPFFSIFVIKLFISLPLLTFIVMELTLITIGKTATPYLVEGIDEYLKRLKRYVPFRIVTLPDVRNSRKLTEDQQKTAEGRLMLDQLSAADLLVLLDERGEEFTSRGFSSWLERAMASGRKRVVFAIGGPYGFSPEVYSRADMKISLSRMTFSHEMVRLFFVEQVYRAMTILRGEPYHHD